MTNLKRLKNWPERYLDILTERQYKWRKVRTVDVEGPRWDRESNREVVQTNHDRPKGEGLGKGSLRSFVIRPRWHPEGS